MTPLQWAVETFGSVAKNRDERAARLVEEAIELAQAEGVSLAVIERIARHVYSKPAGDPVAELQGVALTLDACAENMGESVADATARELARVRSRSASEWKARHDVKVEAGRANLSPAPMPAHRRRIASHLSEMRDRARLMRIEVELLDDSDPRDRERRGAMRASLDVIDFLLYSISDKLDHMSVR